jgi:hypothetical protein
MTKIIIVHNCHECPNFVPETIITFDDDDPKKRWCSNSHKHFFAGKKNPEWCSLDDLPKMTK